MRRSLRVSCRRNRRTCARRRRGSVAWWATAVLPRRDRARSSGYNRSRRGAPRDAPPTTAAASLPPGAAHDGLPPSLAGAGHPSPPPQAGRAAAPASRPSDLPAAASPGRHAAPAGCSPRRPSRSPQGSRRSCVWTCRRRTASARRGSCAWVISVQALPRSLWKRSQAMPIRGSPNGANHLRPQAGRDRLEQVVAINRNA